MFDSACRRRELKAIRVGNSVWSYDVFDGRAHGCCLQEFYLLRKARACQFVLLVCIAMSFGGTAVCRARAKEIRVSDENIAKLEAEGLTTMATFAFFERCRARALPPYETGFGNHFVPQQRDDKRGICARVEEDY